MLNKLQFQNLAELQLQNLDQPLCSKSEKSLVLGPNVSSQICNKLLPTWSSLSTSATVTTSTSFELASSHARVTSIKFTKREWVSQWVSESVSDKHCQWSDSGPIKISLLESSSLGNVPVIFTWYNCLKLARSSGDWWVDGVRHGCAS